MICRESIRDIIRISCQPLGMWSESAEELLLMTAAHESTGGMDLVQIGGGPALGLYQMEPNTLHDNYIKYFNYPGRKKLRDKIESVSGVKGPDLMHLQYNHIYSTIHARIKYWRDSEPLPAYHDAWGLAVYAKRVFNSPGGKATPEKYYRAYKSLIG